jgi:hypothetical protein
MNQSRRQAGAIELHVGLQRLASRRPASIRRILF